LAYTTLDKLLIVFFFYIITAVAL